MEMDFDWSEFALIRADEWIGDQALVPEAATGVYAILMRNAEPILEVSGHFELGGRPPARIDNYVHMYSGASFDLRKRLKSHILGTVRTSTLRKSLLAIDSYYSGWEPFVIGCDGQWDDMTLDNWIAAHSLIAFRPADDALMAEQCLLRATASPLNISLRRTDAYARRLTALRCMLDRKPIPLCCADAAFK